MPKPSRYRQDRAERLALSTYLKLTRASERLWNRLAPGLQREDLTPSQFGVLEALYHLGSHVPARPRRADPQEQRQHDHGDREPREARAWSGAEQSATDRRYHQVHLTAAGERLIRRVFPVHADAITRAARGAHPGGAASPRKPLPEAGSSLMSIHHVTAIAGDPQRNLDFYAGVLGLRLVKLTVNFDDPGTYHLYFGDELGRPGSILTFFPWPDGRRGRQGTGQVGTVSLAIPPASLGFWIERLLRHGIRYDGPDPPVRRAGARLRRPRRAAARARRHAAGGARRAVARRARCRRSTRCAACMA